jgi:hypothetical protein
VREREREEGREGGRLKRERERTKEKERDVEEAAGVEGERFLVGIHDAAPVEFPFEAPDVEGKDREDQEREDEEARHVHKGR